MNRKWMIIDENYICFYWYGWYVSAVILGVDSEGSGRHTYRYSLTEPAEPEPEPEKAILISQTA